MLSLNFKKWYCKMYFWLIQHLSQFLFYRIKYDKWPKLISASEFESDLIIRDVRDCGFPSIINQFVWHPPFRKRTMALILFALWTPNHNRRLIDGFSTAQRQHSKSPVRKVPCFSGKILSLSIIFNSCGSSCSYNNR